MNDQSLKRMRPEEKSPPRPVQRSKPVMSFETTANILDDATHARLDQQVIAEVQDQNLQPGSGTTLLLLIIASNSNDCINPKYLDVRSAKSLLDQNPALGTELWSAYEGKSFKNIRNLSMWNTSIDDICINPNSRNSSTTTTDDDGHGRGCNYSCTGARYNYSKIFFAIDAKRFGLTATEGSWERSYIGEAQKALWMHIERHYNPKNKNVYAHYAAIVQSSGMGKSRAVDELGKEHFSLPINLREPESTGIAVCCLSSFTLY